MGASFGSGASGSLFGATGSANFLSRSTAVCAAVFFVCTLSLAYTANDRPKASAGSVLDRPAAGASAPVAGAPATAASARAASGVALAATGASSAASAAPSVASAVPAIPQK
jgi:preprotein translocase subunit SecG